MTPSPRLPDLGRDHHLAPATPEHLAQEALALSARVDVGRVVLDSLLVTSLRATAPLVLLNVSLGDQAVVAARACGCPLEDLGWTTHLHTIRSYEKLTAGGMTFLDTDLVRVLEEVLPTRFGGGPTDYQLEEAPREPGWSASWGSCGGTEASWRWRVGLRGGHPPARSFISSRPLGGDPS